MLARRLKAVLRVECFENASLPLWCGQMKTEVFEYDDVIVQRKGCFRISIVLAFSQEWAKTTRMHDGWTH